MMTTEGLCPVCNNVHDVADTGQLAWHYRRVYRGKLVPCNGRVPVWTRNRPTINPNTHNSEQKEV